MMPTAELLVMETTRSAACPKQLSTKRNRRKRMTVSFIEACFLCQEYSMGLKLTTRDPENFGFADSRLLPVARQVGPLVVPSVNSVAGWSDVR
jgi:hypothetical protein